MVCEYGQNKKDKKINDPLPKKAQSLKFPCNTSKVNKFLPPPKKKEKKKAQPSLSIFLFLSPPQEKKKKKKKENLQNLIGGVSTGTRYLFGLKSRSVGTVLGRYLVPI
jgi:hypothetical protein